MTDDLVGKVWQRHGVMRSPKSLLFWLIVIALGALVGQTVQDGRLPWTRGDAARPAPAATGDAIAGRARVVDGDSLEVAGHRIRLFGIDAPEGRQTCRDAQGRDYACGQEARRRLAELIGNRDVSCTPVGESHDRDVALCMANGRDLSEALVRAGFAIELRSHSRGRYGAAEREARESKRGMWAGPFERPGAWRQENMR
jgi:endonuclease YncB( thermonuclease family)